MAANYAFLVRNLATGKMRTVVSTSIKAAKEIVAATADTGEEFAIKFRGVGDWEHFKITTTGTRKIS